MHPTPSSSRSISPDDIRTALRSRIADLPDELRDLYKLDASSAEVRRTRVDWEVRVPCSAPLASKRSFDLHRVLSELQRGVEADVGAPVTVLLDE